jgi:hypothetical protein
MRATILRCVAENTIDLGNGLLNSFDTEPCHDLTLSKQSRGYNRSIVIISVPLPVNNRLR